MCSWFSCDCSAVANAETWCVDFTQPRGGEGKAKFAADPQIDLCFKDAAILGSKQNPPPGRIR